MTVVGWQRLEALVTAVAIAVVFVAAGYAWWWLLALFLVYDLSALGYLVNPRVGAFCYNAVHSYVAPAVLAAVGALLAVGGQPATPWIVIAATWAFHVATDRALGYGLKLDDSFGHTHLGPIGRTRRAES